jgi:hypothetical protein
METLERRHETSHAGRCAHRVRGWVLGVHSRRRPRPRPRPQSHSRADLTVSAERMDVPVLFSVVTELVTVSPAPAWHRPIGTSSAAAVGNPILISDTAFGPHA